MQLLTISSNWSCLKCTQPEKSRRYDETASTSSANSFTFTAAHRRTTDKESLTETPSTSESSNMERSSTYGLSTLCSQPNCTIKASTGSGLCKSHLAARMGAFVAADSFSRSSPTRGVNPAKSALLDKFPHRVEKTMRKSQYSSKSSTSAKISDGFKSPSSTRQHGQFPPRDHSPHRTIGEHRESKFKHKGPPSPSATRFGTGTSSASASNPLRIPPRANSDTSNGTGGSASSEFTLYPYKKSSQSSMTKPHESGNADQRAIPSDDVVRPSRRSTETTGVARPKFSYDQTLGSEPVPEENEGTYDEDKIGRKRPNGYHPGANELVLTQRTPSSEFEGGQGDDTNGFGTALSRRDDAAVENSKIAHGEFGVPQPRLEKLPGDLKKVAAKRKRDAMVEDGKQYQFEPSPPVSSDGNLVQIQKTPMMPDEDEPMPDLEEFSYIKPLGVISQQQAYNTLEAARLKLCENFDSVKFDSLFYGQDGVGPPPEGIEIQPRPRPHSPLRGRDDRLALSIDPRIHWTYDKSDRWYEKKMEEIKARGTRKINCRRVVQRVCAQRRKEEMEERAQLQSRTVQLEMRPPRPDPKPWTFGRHIDFGDVPEDQLPDYVKENPAWLRACAWMREVHAKPRKIHYPIDPRRRL
jgi:hypothetical protein